MRSCRARGVEQKPIRCQIGHALERAGFFEQMRRAGNDVDLYFAAHPRTRLFVEVNDNVVFAAHDEERRRFHFWQSVTGKIGPAAPRDDGGDLVGQFGGGHQCRGCAGARPETADAQIARLLLFMRPPRRVEQPFGKEADVEPVLARVKIDRFFLGREQVEQQRGQPGVIQPARHKLIAWTVTTAAAAVRKKHERDRLIDNRQIAIHRRAPSGNSDFVH